MSRRSALLILVLATAAGCGRPTITRTEPAHAQAGGASFAPEKAPVSPPAVAPSRGAPERAPSAPELPAPPVFDLESDLSERRAAALEELGPRADAEVVERVFLVVAPDGRGALAGAIDLTRRATAAYFNGRFSTRPERAVSVYMFPNARSYDAYCRKRWERGCSSPYGFYLAGERQIIMNVGLGIGTLTHELVHPLVETDFPTAPDWINEGIASLFERPVLTAPGQITGAKNWRHPRLMRALAVKSERETARPSALFGMSDEIFRGEREDLNYATARYFCQWLDGKKKLWPFYRRWRDTAADDPSGEKAFVHVMGGPPADFDAEWSRWVRAL